MFKHFVLSLGLACSLINIANAAEASSLTTTAMSITQRIAAILAPATDMAGNALDDAATFVTTNRKPLIVTAVILTVGGATAIAYSKGWFANAKASFEKAKAWASERISC